MLKRLPTVDIEPPEGDIIVFSDLHLGEAWAWQKRSRRTVTVDQMHHVVVGFLDDLVVKVAAAGKPLLLVINGDLFDFDCVRRVPRSHADLARWLELLDAVGCSGHSIDELRAGISEREQADGLDTEEHWAVWRTLVAVRENRPVFSRLARLIGDGVRLVVLRGNHDTELVWPGAQEALRLLLADTYALDTGITVKQLPETIRSRFRQTVVAPFAVRIGRDIYLEHGHRHDHASSVPHDFLPDQPGVLQIPQGSRHVRRHYSQAVPVTPPLGPARALWRSVVEHVLNGLYPVVLVLFLALPRRSLERLVPLVSDIDRPRSGRLPGWRLLRRLRSLLAPRGTHIGWLRRIGTHYLAAKMAPLPRQVPELRHVLLGHSHWPGQRRLGGRCVLYNSGSWLPRYLASDPIDGPGSPFTFVHFHRRSQEWRGRLFRWSAECRRWKKHFG